MNTAPHYYKHQDLAQVIKNQDTDFANFDEDAALEKIKTVKQEKESYLKNKCEELLEQMGEKEKRLIELAQEKGAGSWLSASPIKALGHVLNKQEFRYSVCFDKTI